MVRRCGVVGLALGAVVGRALGDADGLVDGADGAPLGLVDGDAVGFWASEGMHACAITVQAGL